MKQDTLKKKKLKKKKKIEQKSPLTTNLKLIKSIGIFFK